MLAGRVVLVTGGGQGMGRGIALGIEDAGATVVVVDGPIESRAGAARAFADAGAVDAVVHALVDPDALVNAELVDIDEPTWDRRCEAVLRTALWCCQAAFAAFDERGGRIVLVTPTVGLTGGVGLAPYATAVEGMRSLAKSAARQWRSRGVTVNCVAPRIDGAPDLRTDVAPVVAMLLADSAHIVTGATLVVDGGLVMAP
ncbi:MAG: SDR family NAD(P)-dependent oxidoreductase [Acidimicrobiia bacterium]